jgi:hypothetical protein
LKVLAKGRWGYVEASPTGSKEGTQMLIRSPAELATLPPFNKMEAPDKTVQKTAVEAALKALKVEKIDWDKQMLVLVTAGVKPTGGYEVDVESVTAADNTIHVKWKVTPPKGFATQAFTHPALLALVERAEGKAKFETTPAKGPRGETPRPQVRPAPVPAALAAQEQPAGGKEGELKVIARSPARVGAGRGGHTVIRSGEAGAHQPGGDRAGRALRRHGPLRPARAEVRDRSETSPGDPLE